MAKDNGMTLTEVMISSGKQLDLLNYFLIMLLGD